MKASLLIIPALAVSLFTPFPLNIIGAIVASSAIIKETLDFKNLISKITPNINMKEKLANKLQLILTPKRIQSNIRHCKLQTYGLSFQ